DAMTSGRPYRETELSFEGAVAEIGRRAGEQFDPEVAAAVEAAAMSGRLVLIPRATPAGGIATVT
ncbi:MAG TPA: hypothetical protein VFV33_23260, partial [Gemmatimonadaceae bacterium]|nr:hypothetical protein [Gemmatimonadaceae bacterium]